ncbi:hypothetical protein [Bosea sp. BK604]|uniref:hypothetical protein n=1 Tax=Bosea sp. BK604 TaxID=2512180 RepID=UPI0010505E63|nr:hypothetical protein [Bosea sp. BK604]TCR63479.1 hypothetical protein EV560_108126 [Bosea sp. BK604]
MTNSLGSRQPRLTGNIDHAAERDHLPSHHDMDPSHPADSPGNIVRKSQQLKARAAAGRHIDKTLAKVPVSDEAKASRKAKLIDLPDGTPPKPHGKRAG